MKEMLQNYYLIDLNLNYIFTGMAFSKFDANRSWHDTDGRNFANKNRLRQSHLFYHNRFQERKWNENHGR